MKIKLNPQQAFSLLNESRESEGWRMAFAFGKVRHDKGDFTVDRQFGESMKEAFEFLRDTYGYYPPIAAEHEIEIEMPDEKGGTALVSGITYGIVTDVLVSSDGVWVKPQYNELGRRLCDMGAFTYVSPSFYPEYEDPHTGRLLLNVMREFTQCARPHQKNLKTPIGETYGLTEIGELSLSEDGFLPIVPLVTTKEADMPDETNVAEIGDGEEMDEKDIMIADLKAQIAEMQAAMEPAEDPEPEEATEEDEPVEETEGEEVENSDLLDRVAVLERQIALSEAINEIHEAIPGEDSTTVQDLAEMKLVFSDAVFQRWMQRAKDARPSPEIGSVGTKVPVNNSEDNRPKISDLVKSAKDLDVARKDVMGFCTKRGYNLAELDSDEFYEAVKLNFS